MTRILVIQARGPQRTHRLPLGTLTQRDEGWRFMPFTSARKGSRKAHPTWEAALPRWTGGLNRTETIRMEPGESIADALKRFPAVPEFGEAV